MAADLWRSGAPADWAALRPRADEIMRAPGKAGLADLERWAWDELRPAMRARERPHMTKDELGKLVTWWVAATQLPFLACLGVLGGAPGSTRRRRSAAACAGSRDGRHFAQMVCVRLLSRVYVPVFVCVSRYLCPYLYLHLHV